MSSYFSSEAVLASAPGKTILIGEHAAVYGFPALAIPLQDIRVTVTLSHQRFENERGWEDAWSFEGPGALGAIDSATRNRLLLCLERGVQCAYGCSLAEFSPQPLSVCSEIPLGAGMGGSAALSVALLRALVRAAGREEPCEAEFLRVANTMDSAFHGTASGLDVAAVSAHGPILFQRGQEIIPLCVAREFWLMLVDSGSRSPTIDMVEKVRAFKVESPRAVEHELRILGNLTESARMAVAEGDLGALGAAMNKAHDSLSFLKVSTSLLDKLVENLRANGAVGAKLTGAGGGGLVVGVFEQRPDDAIIQSFSGFRCFLTKVSRATGKR
jgi:mevalonate kinase